MINTAVSASVVCLTPLLAGAERISFNLPMEAHWGAVTLQPGQYTFDIPLASSWPQEIVLRQNSGSVRISPMTEVGGAESTRNYLLLVEAGGSYFVREYISGTTGKRFTFGMPSKSLPALDATAPDKKLPD